MGSVLLIKILEGLSMDQSKDACAGSVLSEDHYRAFVTYAKLPGPDQLKAEFSGGVAVEYHGTGDFGWQMTRPYDNNMPDPTPVEQIPGDKIFFVLCFDREVVDDEWRQERGVFAEMSRLGYRPATHIEAYEFAKAYPDVQERYSILALGSLCWEDAAGCGYALLDTDKEGKRWLSTTWSYGWAAGQRFLFIRN